MQRYCVAHVAIPSGGWRPRLSGKVSLETFHCNLPEKKKQKVSSQQTLGYRGWSIEMAFVKDRREELSADN
ncbi:hypothetical protein DPMN_072154 [Dreissena polymorpha]|uniref:Uncharacterized protein n=1 Tax=Dreissena polymorpha TaxID=45954 RepID=A0A9D3Z8Y1_DREPO|nr:hypothetical protein DPMN_072154 [Dreissena polymorpha]